MHLFYVLSSRSALINDVVRKGLKPSDLVLREYDTYASILIDKVYKDMSDILSKLLVDEHFEHASSITKIVFKSRPISYFEFLNIQQNNCFDLKGTVMQIESLK